jgi:hypothetical protein
VPAAAARSRPTPWSTSTLIGLSRSPLVAIDTTAGRAPSGAHTCARTRTTWRLAYGHPRIAGDTGAVVFIATQLDERDQVDSMLFDFRLARSKGKWTVPGWLSESERTHNYVHGEGCYRLSHHPFIERGIENLRIDTILVHADTARIGGRLDSPHALRPEADHVGLTRTVDTLFPSGWSVTHDTLHLTWNGNGYAILRVDLRVQGDALAGVMRYETDAIGAVIPKVPVTGRRVPCPK